MGSNIQISVIVPVYNAGSYLGECLEGVCRQTLRELEVICIDDGSTDDSTAIIQRYMKTDKRIKIIRQTHGGPGCARNRGMQEATGEFVVFLDADDFYMDVNALKQMYTVCMDNRVKICGSEMKYLRQGIITNDPTLKDVKIAANKNRILEYQDFQFDYGFTGFLFSKKMLIEEGIDFPSYKRYEDPCFLVRAMYAAGQFTFCDAALYVCRVPTMASRFTKDKVADLLRGLSDNLYFAHEKKLDKLFHRSLMRLEYEYYSVICRYVSKTDGQQVSLLWKINHLVREVLQNDEYIIRPLSFIISQDSDFWLHYEGALCGTIEKEPYIYLYGAGGMAKRFIRYLQEKSLLYKIRGIIVSVQPKDGQYVEDIPVGTPEGLKVKADDYILIGTGAVFHKDIEGSLRDKGFCNYHILDSVFVEELQEADG